MLGKLFRTNPFFIKLLNKEYWPMWATYWPVVPYYLYLAARARSFFFFTAANPNIETGGLMGESKIKVLDLVDDIYKPKSLFIKANTSAEAVIALIKKEELNYPIIIKPDVGERGLLVQKITEERELVTALKENQIDFIIQPFITLKEELAVMYYRYPNEERGKVISVTLKKFLSVTGDGVSTMKELIWQNSRAILQWKPLQKKYGDRMTEILPKGKTLELVSIGNHAKGTMFLNGNHLIDERMELVFDDMVKNMEGVYFGRFDLKCSSIEDLKNGKNIQVMEFNGVGAEPAHIYDPNYPLWDTYKDLLNQWTIMFKVGTYVHKNLGVPYMTFKEARAWLKQVDAYKDGLNTE